MAGVKKEKRRLQVLIRKGKKSDRKFFEKIILLIRDWFSWRDYLQMKFPRRAGPFWAGIRLVIDLSLLLLFVVGLVWLIIDLDHQGFFQLLIQPSVFLSFPGLALIGLIFPWELVLPLVIIGYVLVQKLWRFRKSG